MRHAALLVFILICDLLNAQIVDVQELRPDTSARYKFEMRDGSLVYGSVTAADRMSITVETLQLGTVIMQRGSIREARRVDHDQYHYYKDWRHHPNPMDYFVAPSGHMLEKGGLNYRTTYFLLHQVDVGITDWLTIGGGTELVTLLNWDQEIPHVFLRTKIGHRIAPDLRVAVSGLLVNGPVGHNWWYRPRRHERYMHGALHGVLTYGSTDNHVSAGGGMAFRGERRTDGAFLTLSGSVRLSRRVSLMSDNWYIVETEQLVNSLGMRLHGANLSVDLGAGTTASEYTGHIVQPFPFVALGVQL